MNPEHDSGPPLHDRLGELLDALPDAILVTDRQGSIVLANHLCTLLFGYDREELLGQTVEVLVPRRLQGMHARQRTDYAVHPRTRPMHSGLPLIARRKDGTEFPAEISLSPLGDPHDGYVAAAIRDITPRIRAEEARREAMKVAHEELESFTYSVSHDLRAPLRQVDGFCRILAEEYAGQLDPRGRGYLDRVLDGTRYMQHMLETLLELARIGAQEVRLTPTPLDQVVRRSLDELANEINGREIDWSIDPLPIVHADPVLLQVVMTNLLSNALKYTRPTPEPRIDIRSTLADGKAVIVIQDNGVGFDMAHADKLFGVFQRMHRAEEFEGSGVGLATVRRIIRKHGQNVSLHAEPGAGARVTFTLELVTA